MGVGRNFSRGGAVGDLPKNFSRGGPKVVKFVFYPSKLKKQPFFANNFKIQGAKLPPALPSDAHACISLLPRYAILLCCYYTDKGLEQTFAFPPVSW